MIRLCTAGVLFAAMTAVSAAAQGTSQLKPEQARILESAREQAMEYTARLPNFICTQITERAQSLGNAGLSSFVGGRSAMQPQENAASTNDRIVERLTYFNQQESYKVVSFNGKEAKGVDHLSLGGAISTGEFGSALREIFSPYAETVFRWSSSGRMRGHRVLVFDYEVPKDSGVTVVGTRPNERAMVAYHGQVSVDEASSQVLRMSSTLELPLGFSITQAERSVDYESINLAGALYTLPVHSEVKMESAGIQYHNAIDFKDYRKFMSEATLHFGGEALQQTPGAESRPAGEEDGTATAPPSATAEPTSKPAEVAPEGQPAGSAPAAAQSGTGLGVGAATAPVEPAVASATSAEASATSLPSARSVAQPEAGQAAVEKVPLLRIDVNLVQAPVVVRDGKGQAVEGLRQEDFEIFDEGKRQPIVSFTVVRQPGQTAKPGVVEARPEEGRAAASAEPRFIVFLFDDLHLKFADLVHVREAARKSLERLPAADQVALITTSGLVELSFTLERAKFTEALAKLRAEPVGGAEQRCPNLSEYMAGLILQQGDSSPTMQLAISETFDCAHLDRNPATLPTMIELARKMALQTARSVQSDGEMRNRTVTAQLREVVRWLAKAPGPKKILLATPGFFLDEMSRLASGQVMDEAIRAEVVIDTLDARGLYTQEAAGNPADRLSDVNVMVGKAALAREADRVASELMEDLASGTGGAYIHDTNDLSGELERVLETPATTYLIGFKPAKLKTDGRFHHLKVKVLTKEKGSVQSRKGYFAPKQ